MCGRFYVPAEDPELLAVLTEANRKAPAHLQARTGELRPGDAAAVWARSRSGRFVPFAMRWGYRLNDGKLVFNARSETAAGKPLFRDGMLQRRCLIPAAAYFEWDHRQAKPPKLRFARSDGRLLLLAGLYRPEADAAAFTILTREPTQALSVFHDRMPVILDAAQREAWLSGAPAGEVLAGAVDALRWETA